MRRVIRTVLAESAMGTSVNAQKNANSEYVRAVKEWVV